MKIVILQPSYEGSESIIAKLDPKRNLDAWLPPSCTEVEYAYLRKSTVNKQMKLLKGDVFVNLCDGAWDEDTPGEEVVRALEKLKRAFTGSHSAFYDPSKGEMKMFCYYWNIKTPAYVIASDRDDVDRAANILKFPLFVKHEHGYNSVGITEKSKVHNAEELHEQAAKMMGEFGCALIEEFVEGREFSVLVSSNPDDPHHPFAYRPVECVFDEKINFKTFDYKWKGTRNPWIPVTDEELTKKLQEMTKALFVAGKATGYARSDIRMDKNGDLYLLEINPNCSVFYADNDGATADIILQYDIGKAAFLQRMIDFALHRQKQGHRKYIIRQTELGNGLVAAEDIPIGDIVQHLEESPHYLVSRSYVAKNWDAKNREFFDHFAYPLTDEVYAMWDPDPNNWSPINHGCEPNTWLEGLDLVARKSIRKGDALTMDYATMYTTNPVNFTCLCGAVASGDQVGCRGTWKGDDYLQPWFIKKYGDHVTDCVRQARKHHLKKEEASQ